MAKCDCGRVSVECGCGCGCICTTEGPRQCWVMCEECPADDGGGQMSHPDAVRPPKVTWRAHGDLLEPLLPLDMSQEVDVSLDDLQLGAWVLGILEITGHDICVPASLLRRRVTGTARGRVSDVAAALVRAPRAGEPRGSSTDAPA